LLKILSPLKIQPSSAGFELAKLESNSKHATTRPRRATAYILIRSLHLRLCLPSVLLGSDFPTSLLDLITLLNMGNGDNYESPHYAIFFLPKRLISFSVPNVALGTMFSVVLNLWATETYYKEYTEFNCNHKPCVNVFTVRYDPVQM
jgi:hypothetical protein